MRRLFIFRTNLKSLESYHQYNNLEDFKKRCWDFYLLQGIVFLENSIFDEVVIWRLFKDKKQDIIFDINGKKFIQKFVNNLNECLKYAKPEISFFRGGFSEYDILTRNNPDFFGIKLYLAAGKRIYPQYGGLYDKILIEDERDINFKYKCIPFFKTANPNIFRRLNCDKIYDICFISNFTQYKYKGQKEFIREISESKYLKSLKILHIGNNSKDGIKICNELRVENIEFADYLSREEINLKLNQSKIGIVLSNLTDGCPRVSTEILSSGLPLMISDSTRFLKYYRELPLVFPVEFGKIEKVYKKINFEKLYTKNNIKIMSKRLDIIYICNLNISLWRS